MYLKLEFDCLLCWDIHSLEIACLTMPIHTLLLKYVLTPFLFLVGGCSVIRYVCKLLEGKIIMIYDNLWLSLRNYMYLKVDNSERSTKKLFESR